MLKGEKIYLRPFRQPDLAFFAQYMNDIQYISEYSFFGMQSEDSLEKRFLESGLLGAQHGNFVVSTYDELIAGKVSYHQQRYGPGEASIAYNIGILLDPEQRGKGYGVEAQRLLTEYLFSTYLIMRVEASTDVTNIPEQRALEKAGFQRDSVMRKAQWRSGEWHDIAIYSKLRGGMNIHFITMLISIVFKYLLIGYH